MRFAALARPRVLCTTVLSVAALCTASLVPARSAGTQIDTGGFAIVQPHHAGPVGWACRTPDGTTEWWAYIDGEYRFANASATTEQPWVLHGVSVSSATWTSYEAFVNAVRAMPETAGKKLIFDLQTTCRQTIQN